MHSPIVNVMQISREKLLSWGVLRNLKREEIVDKYLKDIPSPTPDEVLLLTKEWCTINHLKEEKLFNEWKIINGFDIQNWNYFVSRKWKWEKWCISNFKDQINSYYLERKEMLDHVTYSLVRVKTKNLADELYMRIKEGEVSFNDIAKKYSEGPEMKTGGLIGPFPMNRAHPQLAEILRISQKGQLWSPTQIDNWWVVLRIEKIDIVPLDKNTALNMALELGENFLKKELDDLMRESLDKK